MELVRIYHCSTGSNDMSERRIMQPTYELQFDLMIEARLPPEASIAGCQCLAFHAQSNLHQIYITIHVE